MSLTKVLITVALLSVIIFCERLFPFVIFSKKSPGKLLYFFERYIPPFVMLALLVYSLKGIRFSSLEMWLPATAGTVFAISTYLWKKSTMLSIFGATAIYMILIRLPL